MNETVMWEWLYDMQPCNPTPEDFEPDGEFFSAFDPNDVAWSNSTAARKAGESLLEDDEQMAWNEHEASAGIRIWVRRKGRKRWSRHLIKWGIQVEVRERKLTKSD